MKNIIDITKTLMSLVLVFYVGTMLMSALS